MIQGTNLNYTFPSSRLEKSLVLIGSGFNSDVDGHKLTIISNCCGYGNVLLYAAATGSKFYGIVFGPQVSFSQATSNLTFENCRFDNQVRFNNHTSNNVTFRNCAFTSDNNENVYLPNTAPITTVFENCIFDGWIQAHNNGTLTTLFNHCLFFRTNGAPLSQFNNTHTVSNCIFVNDSTIVYNSNGGVFNNNIALLNATLPPSGASGSGNLVNTDPQFLNYTAGQLYLYEHDYDVQAGSPAEGAATDSTDIGIHGGFTHFSETGEVLITPIIRSMNINNTSVVPGATLSVQLKATKPNTD